jgi:hypothetical protein
VADSTARIEASKVTPEAAVVVNGSDTEWGCVDRLAFEIGGRSVGVMAGHDVAKIAVQWDEQHLYFLAAVTSDAPGGTAAVNKNFQNDSMHFFVTGPNPQPRAGYRASDHQIVIDALGQVTDYAVSTRPTITGITAKVGPAKEAGGALSFVIEARVDAAVLGRNDGFKAGDVVRVNFQINDNAAASYRIWYWQPTVCAGFTGCSSAVGAASEPYCDPHCTGEVLLR